MLFRVEVDVATKRPPKNDATLYFIVAADNWIQAEVTACIMAVVTRPQVVMPVATRSEIYHAEDSDDLQT